MFVALSLMQCPCAISSYLACMTRHYFSTLSRQRPCFHKKKWLNVKCVLISWKLVQNISHSKKWAKYDKKCIFAFMYCTRFSCQIWKKFGLSRQILVIHSYQISWKSLRWDPSYSEERQKDRQTDWLNEWLTDWLTDMTKLIVAFRNFANAPKKREGKHEEVVYLYLFIYCNWVVTRWQWLFYI